MTVAAVVEHCPNCGAPLQIDAAGTCHWCGGYVWLAAGRAPSDPGAAVALRREQQQNLCDADSSLPLPAYPVLSSLWMLSFDPVVQDFLDQPGLIEISRRLTSVVQTAGERVRDAGQSDKALPGERMYTPDDWWAFDLGIDLIVRLIALPGIKNDHRALADDTVTSHDKLWHHHPKKALKQAGDGPEPLRPLRAFISHRASP